VNFASEKEIAEILDEEEKMEKQKNEVDVFDEEKYDNYVQFKASTDPNFIVPYMDPETLRQVRALEKQEALNAKKHVELKPVEGVKMVEYNADFGIPQEALKENANFFKTDLDERPPDLVINPPADYKYPHLIIDVDKEYHELSPEEKEVRDCLENESEDEKNSADILEDDFVLKANGGVPALVEVKEAKKPEKVNDEMDKQIEDAMAEYEDEEDEEFDENSEENEPETKHLKLFGGDKDSDEEDSEDEPTKMTGKEGKMTKEQIKQMLDDYIAGKEPKTLPSDNPITKSGLPLDPIKNKGKDEENEEESENNEDKKELITRIMALEEKAALTKESDSDIPEPELPKKETDITDVIAKYKNTVNRPNVVEEVICKPKKSTADKISEPKILNVKQELKPTEKQNKPVERQEILKKSISEMTKEEKAAFKKEIKAKQKERRALKKATKQAYKVFCVYVKPLK